MQWYQRKEYGAGNLRLKLSWFVYNIFGRKGLDVIIFFVTLTCFIFIKSLRKYSKKYLEVIRKYTGLKPGLINQFRHCHSYAKTLGDKVEIFSNSFDMKKLYFEEEEIKTEIYKDIDLKKGVFFLCSHIGSIDVLRMFIKTRPQVEVNIFVSEIQSKIFNGFLKTIDKSSPVNTYRVEEIGIDTSITLKDSLDNGNIVFIAGDRVSENENSSSFSHTFLGQKIQLPQGAFKLAQLMEVPIYFISTIKDENSKFKVIAQKHCFINLENLKSDYISYLEKLVLKYPLQYYQFYDFFSST